jgi:hypothetical protein
MLVLSRKSLESVAAGAPAVLGACPTPVPTVHEDKQPPVATFKTSLRDWQARYKARRAIQAPVSGKAHNQAAPDERVVSLFTRAGGLPP